MTSWMVRLTFVALLLSILCQPVLADERITHFQSDITIDATGRLTVLETIDVVAENAQIKHGIVRDLPGNTRFDVLEVTLDGHSEPFSMTDGARIRIGRADRFVSRGTHRYSLTYRTRPLIRFRDAYDELYWNATGNGWAFPIESADATVHLPGGAEIQQLAFYTGSVGATAQDAMADQSGTSEARFVTTKRLDDHQGLTVSVHFSKNAVQEPTSSQRVTQQVTSVVADNPASTAALVGLLGLIAYYVTVWLLVIRTPARGRIEPVSAPPNNLSPAAIRFNARMKYDSKALVAAMTGMAVKGYITISEDEGVYTLKRTGMSEAEARFTGDERVLAQNLIGDRDEITLKNDNSSAISKARSELAAMLKRENESIHFRTNWGWWCGGPAIIVITAAAMIQVSGNSTAPVNPVYALVLLVQIVLPILFFPLMKSRTAEGLELRDEIAGFRMFLTSPDKEITREVFERFLPYAIALDVEDAWGRKFAGPKPVDGVVPEEPYRPLWYGGTDYPIWGIAFLSSNMGSSFDTASVDPAAAAASSSTPDSSTWSGGDSGGGGFSGGGDGGGGGGGW